MDKTKCPDCGGPLDPLRTSIGVGYYCPHEDKFIGDYYEGLTPDQYGKRYKKEAWALGWVFLLPIIIFIVFLADIFTKSYSDVTPIEMIGFLFSFGLLIFVLIWTFNDMRKIINGTK